MGEQMFTMKNQVFSWPSVVNDLFKVLTKKFVKDSASQFENFHVNFHKLYALFSMRLSQLGMLSQILLKMGSENAHGCTQNAEKGFSFCGPFRVIPQR
jgi:hypothetical protein